MCTLPERLCYCSEDATLVLVLQVRTRKLGRSTRCFKSAAG